MIEFCNMSSGSCQGQVLNIINTCQTQSFNENLQHSLIISIKALQTKFIPYLNQLNSSIHVLKKKSMKSSSGSDQISLNSLSGDDMLTSFQSFNQKYGNVQSKGKKKLRRQNSTRLESKEKMKIKITGKGEIQLQDGSFFKGFLENGQLKHGQLKLTSGIIYEGQFKDSFFHGKGQLKFSNGTLYKSTFKNGQMQQKGQIIYENGDVYKGQIQKYKKHGLGQMIFANGNKYVGSFKNGEISGYGTYFINQYPVAKGRWKQGQFMGNSSNNVGWKDQIIQESTTKKKA